MESIGEKLTKARTAKGYTREQIARDTHISQHYIEDLEQERFEAFPGETYLFGYIRKYAGYLDLDPREMISLYRNQQLQEQPAPIEQLLNPKPPATGRIVVVTLIVIAAAGIAGLAFALATGQLQLPSWQEQVSVAADPAEDRQQMLVHLTQHFLEQQFFVGDAIVVPLQSDSYRLQVLDIDDEVWVSAAGETSVLPFDSSTEVDVNGDGQPDIRVRVVDASPRSDGGVVLRIDRSVDGPEAAARSGSDPGSTDDAAPIGSTSIDSRQREAVLVRDADAVSPIQVRVVGSDVPALVRLQTYDGTVLQEQLSADGTIQAESSRYVQLYVSNAGAVTVNVNGTDVNLGSDGEIRVVRFAWSNGLESERPRLEQIPVY